MVFYGQSVLTRHIMLKTLLVDVLRLNFGMVTSSSTLCHFFLTILKWSLPRTLLVNLTIFRIKHEVCIMFVGNVEASCWFFSVRLHRVFSCYETPKVEIYVPWMFWYYLTCVYTEKLNIICLNWLYWDYQMIFMYTMTVQNIIKAGVYSDCLLWYLYEIRNCWKLSLYTLILPTFGT